MTEYILLNGEVSGSTDKAIKMVVSGATAYDLTEHWIPRSVCEDGDDISIGDEEISVAKWYADKNDIPY